MSLAFRPAVTFFSGHRVGSRRENILVHRFPMTTDNSSVTVKCSLSTKGGLMGITKEKFEGPISNSPIASALRLADIPSSLCIIDSLERLGIDRYFRSQIDIALEDTYRLWQQKDKDIYSNVTTHAMAFRLLRVKGYEVSSEELAPYANQERFNKQEIDEAMAIELYRAAQERIYEDESSLEKLLAWTTTFLKHQLFTNSILDYKLHKLVEYYSSNYDGRIDRVGVRLNLDLYDISHYQTLKPSHRLYNLCTEDFLAFARQDFHISQAQYQKEHEQLQRWNAECGLEKLKYGRDVVRIGNFLASSWVQDPELSQVRLSMAKIFVLTTRVDDFFDHAGSKQQSYKIIELVNEWKENPTRGYDSEEVKILFTAIYNTVNEVAEKAHVQQGRNVKEFLVKLWVEILSVFKMELDTWSDGTEVSFEEYLSWISSGCRLFILTSMLLLPTQISHEMLMSEECTDLCRHVSIVGRLLNDIRSFEREREEKTGNSVSILVGAQGVSEEEAVTMIKEIAEYHKRKLMQIVYKRGTIFPRECKDMFLNTYRATSYLYWSIDELTSPKQMKEDMKRISCT